MRLTLLLLAISFLGCTVQQNDQTSNQLPSSIAPGPDEQLAKGFVFNDLNENRVMDTNEAGIAGVFVSNGVDLVQTDSEGKYEIPVADDAIVFVIKPADWMTPLNEDNLPQFYYLHKPNGFPANFTYKGVDPTGELPEQINFPLINEQNAQEFKMVVFGDPQPYNIEQIDFFAEDIIVELIGRDDLDFGMTMGDIIGDSLDLFSPLNQAVAKIGIPWYNVLGNHDVNYMAPNDVLSDETYERVYGPATYAFVYGDVHFIIVDNVIHESQVGSRNYVGGLRPDQIEFVENYLSVVPKEDLVVLSMHIPLAQHGTSFRESDQLKLFELLNEFPNTLSISAHTHVHDNRFFHEGDYGWKHAKPHHHFNVGTTSGSWWNGFRSETDIPHTMMRDGTPNGYSFITFKGIEYIIDWKVAGSPDCHQMNIHLPRGIVANSADTTLLTVNFFNGSEESKLEYKIKGLSEWQPMTKVDEFDPYYVKISQRWQNFQQLELDDLWLQNPNLKDQPFPGSPMPGPRVSTHLWQANLGTQWPAGRHIIEVKAEDRYGRTHTAYQVMRVRDN